MLQFHDHHPRMPNACVASDCALEAMLCFDITPFIDAYLAEYLMQKSKGIGLELIGGLPQLQGSVEKLIDVSQFCSSMIDGGQLNEASAKQP
jgi:hypothetical protein